MGGEQVRKGVGYREENQDWQAKEGKWPLCITSFYVWIFPFDPCTKHQATKQKTTFSWLVILAMTESLCYYPPFHPFPFPVGCAGKCWQTILPRPTSSSRQPFCFITSKPPCPSRSITSPAVEDWSSQGVIFPLFSWHSVKTPWVLTVDVYFTRD